MRKAIERWQYDFHNKKQAFLATNINVPLYHFSILQLTLFFWTSAKSCTLHPLDGILYLNQVWEDPDTQHPHLSQSTTMRMSSTTRLHSEIPLMISVTIMRSICRINLITSKLILLARHRLKGNKRKTIFIIVYQSVHNEHEEEMGFLIDENFENSDVFIIPTFRF